MNQIGDYLRGYGKCPRHDKRHHEKMIVVKARDMNTATAAIQLTRKIMHRCKRGDFKRTEHTVSWLKAKSNSDWWALFFGITCSSPLNMHHGSALPMFCSDLWFFSWEGDGAYHRYVYGIAYSQDSIVCYCMYWGGLAITVCLGSTNNLCLGERLRHVNPLGMT